MHGSLFSTLKDNTSFSPVVVLLWALASTALCASVRYVDVSNTNGLPPDTNWITASTTIQDAVDVSEPGDEVVVTNGVYAKGGREGSRVDVRLPILIRSVNGPIYTTIEGQRPPGTTIGPEALRCVYLTNGASLVGFTLTNGTADACGGLLFARYSMDAQASRCIIISNFAAGSGGGVSGYYESGRWIDCSISNNWAGLGGGGADHTTLVNSRVTGNFPFEEAALSSV